MSSSDKFLAIEKCVKQSDNILSVSKLCKIAGVSRSGYYNWINSAEKRQLKELKDKDDFAKILEAYQFKGYNKGVKGIYMRLYRTDNRMNQKKIRRLMRKYGLYCPIRKPNPYKQMVNALKTSNYADNIVNRNFKKGVRKVLLTDISYIPYNNKFCYLSTILDAYTKEILAYELSKTLRVDFVIRTVDQLVIKHGSTLDDEVIVHSDQGCHYTSYAFIKKLKDENFVQSMSRRGNCWDNAPQEGFFGHMKDEIMPKITLAKIFEEVKAVIDDWMDYYNNERYQWELGMLAPSEYYSLITTGFNPLDNINYE